MLQGGVNIGNTRSNMLLERRIDDLLRIDRHVWAPTGYRCTCPHRSRRQPQSHVTHVSNLHPKQIRAILSIADKDTHQHTSKRSILLGIPAILTALIQPHIQPPTAEASKLPAFADRAWEALGGGPSDLTFPDDFEGVWNVESTLKQVELPLGEDMVPDLRAVRRAQREDLGKPVRYQVAFVRNTSGDVVFDRAFNTASMLSFYYERPASDFLPRIQWNRDDPNVLSLGMPGGLDIRTRVTRRSQANPAEDRIETSEYLEQVFDTSSMAESSGPGPRVKASQCFTKYKWRKAPAGQPGIVATQIVSDYLTPSSGQEAQYLQAMNKPITLYTYRVVFTRA